MPTKPPAPIGCPKIPDLTPEEIKQIALERAGGVTATGQVLNAQANLAAQLNPLYHQYTGAGVSREDDLSAGKCLTQRCGPHV